MPVNEKGILAFVAFHEDPGPGKNQHLDRVQIVAIWAVNIHSEPLKNDVMIIIGSKTSANTKRLYQISKALNKRSYWIRSSAEVQEEWFKGARTVGIMAGASTPDTTTKDIVARIQAL